MKTGLIALILVFSLTLRAGVPDPVVNLGDRLKDYGYAAKANPADGVSTWTRAGFEVVAEEETATLIFGGTTVWLESAVKDDGKGLVLHKSDFDKTVAPILSPSPGIARPIRTIALDAGHGGKDPGNSSKTLGLDEKTLTADIVKTVKARLEKSGYRVVLIRPGDAYIPRQDRPAIINRLKPDLFISVHFNAAKDKEAHGVETYCLTPAFFHSTNDRDAPAADLIRRPGNRNDDANILLSYYVQRAMVRSTGMTDRGVRRGRWDVLTELACPGVLVECGFLSNTAEAKLIADPAYRENRIAQGVCEAVAQYHAKLISLAAQKR